MPRSRSGKSAESTRERTISSMLGYFGSATVRAELESFRVSYEAEHGNTDLTKRYTSTWPSEDQEWLLKNFPKRYFDGLPPFMQAYFKAKMVAANKQGNLDDTPDPLLMLYLSGQMDLGGQISL